MKDKLNAVSLFSSSGIGDLGLKANGIETVIACEIVKERMSLLQRNFPATKCFCGDIWQLQSEIIRFYKNNFSGDPFIVLATPPCQGMSSNGMGKLLNNRRKGLGAQFDERNRLIIPALNIARELKPDWIILENVPNMENTRICDETGKTVTVVECMHDILGDEYVGRPETVDCADYGIAQHRIRLITVLTRTNEGIEYFEKHQTFLPPKTHAQNETAGKQKWLSVRDVIGNLPPLRAEKDSNANIDIPLHRVPVLDKKKLWWLDNTPEGSTAFNNQCVNPDCKNNSNAAHGMSLDENGINRAKTDTPLYCEKCGRLLPRPYTEDKITGEKRLMKGYTSAYKRMYWDEPASTLTQNFQYACSDNKVHPSQTRVLSLWEAMLIQTIADYPYSFEIDCKQVRDGLIRDTIGESVPPKLIDLTTKNILAIMKKSI